MSALPRDAGGAAAADWLPYPEALAAALDRCRPLGSEEEEAGEALGRALAEEVASPVDHPPWDDSAMDGFAVRAEDVEGATAERPVVLPVAADVPAGAFPPGPLEPGTAVRVMTGAPVPAGASGVVRVEHTDGGREGRVTIRDDADARRHIRPAGEDIRAGQVLLTPGREVGPGEIAVLALAGRSRVRVGRRPRVAILATGDELAGPEAYDQVRTGRKIADTNSPALAAQVRAAGAVPLPLGIAPDEPEAVRARIDEVAAWDVLLTSAGVSVGERDPVKEALEASGFERVFWRVRVRPGSALLFGTLGGRPCFGLPGNPVSAMVGFEAFVRPALRSLAGHARPGRRPLAVVAGERIGSKAGITHFHRVRLEDPGRGAEGAALPGGLAAGGPVGPPVARLTGPQGSGMLHSMAAADALLIVPEGLEAVEAGERAWALPLRD